MHTYSYTKILKFYKFRTFGVFYENLQHILLLKNFKEYIIYQKYVNISKIQRIYYVFKITGHDVKSEWLTNDGLLSWSLVVIRGHSWSFVVTRGHSWSFVVTRGHSCVLLDKTQFTMR